MAPIALKDKRIEELTKQLVKRFIAGEVSRWIFQRLLSNGRAKFIADLSLQLAKKNVPVAAQFALSNFR